MLGEKTKMTAFESSNFTPRTRITRLINPLFEELLSGQGLTPWGNQFGDSMLVATGTTTQPGDNQQIRELGGSCGVEIRRTALGLFSIVSGQLTPVQGREVDLGLILLSYIDQLNQPPG